MRLTASPNVIAEDLHNTKNLETTFYVTDATQASDFRWERDSGINVNIGILRVHLIPEYSDVTHRSDNLYMEGLEDEPGALHDISSFRNVQQNYCRYGGRLGDCAD